MVNIWKELEQLVDASSLFGDPVIVLCIQLGDNTHAKDELKRLLDRMQESSNIFVIDEPFADVHLFNRLTKVSKKVFDAREEKIKDMSVLHYVMPSFLVTKNKHGYFFKI